MRLEANLLADLFNRLLLPRRRRPGLQTPSWPAASGRRFVTLVELSEVLAASDFRLDRVALEPLARQIGLPMVQVATDSRGAERSTHALYEADAVRCLLFFKQMGFDVVPDVAIDLIRSQFSTAGLMTLSERQLIRYARRGGKRSNLVLSPLTTVQRELEESPIREQMFRTGTGYMVNAVLQGNTVHRVLILSPGWRPDPVREIEMIQCAQCGYVRERGNRDAATEHFRNHAKWKRTYDPAPFKHLPTDARPIPLVFVTTRSRKEWHQAMYDRALAFKRELSFDWAQWTEPRGADRESLREGVLFVAENDVLEGAAAFIPKDRTGSDPEEWELDWVWIRPLARRTGLLARAWPTLLERYGTFSISLPISPEMSSFLQNHDHQGAPRS